MIKKGIALLTGVFYSAFLLGEVSSDSLRYEKHLDQFYDAYRVGTYQKGFPAIRQALEIAETGWGKHSEAYIKAHNNLSLLHNELGNFKKALPLFRETEELIKASVGKQHRSYPILLNNLACLYLDMGCYAKALEIYEKGIKFSEKVMGLHHPLHPILINNKGNTLEKQGHIDSVFPLYRKALKLDSTTRKAVYQDQHADHFNDLARLYLKKGEDQKALAHYQEAQAIFQDTIGTHHPHYGNVLSNLGQFYQETGDPGKARSYYRKALSHTKNHLSKNHPKYLTCLNNLAGLYMETRQHQKARQYHRKLQDHVKTQLYHKFSFLSDKEKANYLSRIQSNFEKFQAFTAQTHEQFEELPGKVYNNQLLLNNLLLKQSRVLRQQILEKEDQELKATFEHWKRLKRYLARQYSLPENQRTEKLDSVKNLANQLERTLSRESDQFQEKQKGQTTTWENVQNQLGQNEVAIEFISYRPWSGDFRDSTIYAALLLTPSSAHPQFIPLFRESQLKALLSKKEKISEKAYISELYDRNGHGSRLYQLLWSPLEPHLEQANTVYFTPSGLLHQISFKALPHPTNPYLGSRYNLVRLNSTGKLAKEVPNPESQSIALFGGIQYDYDTAGKQPSPEQPQLVMKDMPGYEQTRSIRGNFDYLEGSLKEVKAIENMMDRATQTNLITGAKARESTIKSLSGNSPQILHISTHGYFFPDNPDSTGSSNNKLVFKHARNPMLRSGLAFAGSNYAWENGYNPYEEENGILTGYEIANLDLSQTDMVVLSACETGLGEIRGSEGVYGLQRAFRMAGAEYLVMSLWKVPDEPTRKLMEAFYDHWLSGEPVRQAFDKAQQELAEEYPPYFWASFVLVGGGKADFDQIQASIASGRWGIAGWSLVGILLILGGWGFYKKVIR